jgi:hypothetical protein
MHDLIDWWKKKMKISRWWDVLFECECIFHRFKRVENENVVRFIHQHDVRSVVQQIEKWRKRDDIRRVEWRSKHDFSRRRVRVNDDRRRVIIVRYHIAVFDDFFSFDTKDTFVKHISDHIARSINQFACSTDLSDYSAHCSDFVDNRDMRFVNMIMLRHDDAKVIYYEDDNLICVIMKEIDKRKIDTKEIDTRISFLRFNLICFICENM